MASLINSLLQSSKILTLSLPTSNKFAAGEKKEIKIAPRNAGLFMAGVPSSKIPKEKLKKLRAEAPLPEIWDWVHDYPEDTPNEKAIKQGGHITPVGNQESCGCCYAFSMAQAMSDNFVVTGKTKFGDNYVNPSISVTSVLQQGQKANDGKMQINGVCSGGLAPQLAKFFIDNQSPLYSNHCMDFSWCSENSGCTSGDNLLPSFGCIDAGEKLGYTIKNLGTHVLDPLGKENTPEKLLSLDPYECPGKVPMPDDPNANFVTYRESVKRRIRDFGPILGLFIVPKNFFPSVSVKNPYAITEDMFLEVFDYGKQPNTDISGVVDQKTVDNFVNGAYVGDIRLPDDFGGGHAVSIVGWGTSKNEYVYGEDAKGNKLKARIPYWLVRNSWTDKWANNGYFKMPMYPFNRVVQFDRQVPFPADPTRNQCISIGGHYWFDPDTIMKEDYTKTNYSGPKVKPDDFYSRDAITVSDLEKKKSEPEKKPDNTPPKPDNVVTTPTTPKNYLKYITIFLGILVFVAIAYAAYISYKKRSVSTPSVVKPVVSQTVSKPVSSNPLLKIFKPSVATSSSSNILDNIQISNPNLRFRFLKNPYM